MTAPGDPRWGGGRHASPQDGVVPGVPRYTGGLPPVPRYEVPVDVRREAPRYEAPRYEAPRYEAPRYEAPRHEQEWATGGHRRVSGLLDRYPSDTGPLVEPDWWSDGSSDGRPLTARHSGDHRPSEPRTPADDDFGGHPSAPLPPMPTGAWDRLRPREGRPETAETVAQPAVPPPWADARAGDEPPEPGGRHSRDDEHDHDDHHETDEHDGIWDETGGLEVIGAHVEDLAPGRRRRRGRRATDTTELHAASADGDAGAPAAPLDDDEIPLKPYDHRADRRRRRRRPFSVLAALIVLVGIVVGIVMGGQKLIGMLGSRDYTGQGHGSVDIRVKDGDTLSDIGRTLVQADVVASVGPFTDAADEHPEATAIQPGVYRMSQQMSGQAALNRLMDPKARLLARVTIPEGLTVKATLKRLADKTGVPIQQLEAAAADPAALGLPPYANGKLEGFLFPATYDFEPGTAPVDMLKAMVAHSAKTLDALQIPVEQRLAVVTKASIVQAEASSTEDMAKVARVLDNRLAISMPLQLDTTVNYANGKTGLTTTSADRANPSPYNTYLHPGLTPGPISNPGEDALRAVLNPTPGKWLFFVVVDPETGDTRFAVTADEHQRNVQLFQKWLREHPGE